MLAKPLLWPLYAFAALAGVVSAISVASIRAWPARLVPPDELPAAFALEGASYNANALVGPAVAGGLIAVVDVGAAFLLDAATFLLAIVLVARMKHSRPDRRKEGLASVREGFRVVRENRLVATILGLDFTAMLFGMPLALLPALAEELGVGAGILGLLYAAPAAGGLIAVAVSGTVVRARHPGRGVLLALLGWSVGIILVGLANVPWLAWVGLAIAGAGNNVSALLGNAISQAAVSDDVRGRLAAMDDVASSAGPALGDVESGVVAGWLGVGPTILLGGAFSFLGVAVVGALGRQLRAVTRRDLAGC
jgi:MFS family permease